MDCLSVVSEVHIASKIAVYILYSVQKYSKVPYATALRLLQLDIGAARSSNSANANARGAHRLRSHAARPAPLPAKLKAEEPAAR